MPPVHFTTELIATGGSWTFIFFPRLLLGMSKGVRVKGTVNGAPFAISAMPWKHEQYVITVSRELRDRLGIKAGDQLDVELEIDASPVPEVALPPDLEAAVQAREGGPEQLGRLSPSRRKWYAGWITNAKRQETRAKRLLQAVEMIVENIDPMHRPART